MEDKFKSKEFQVEFGKVVRRRRERLGLSQEEFALKANMHRTYVSSIELAKVDVGIAMARRVAKSLGTSLSNMVRNAELSLGEKK